MTKPPRKAERRRTGRSQPRPALTQASRRALLVLGMHRSGTSAVTRVINLLGADIAHDLMAGRSDNPSGHWESEGLAQIHDRILVSAGTTWHDWRTFNPDWSRSDVAASHKKALLDFLSEEFAKSRLFVVKDPRMCRFVPVWLDVLREFDAVAAPVIVVRNPLEVAASLKRRDGMLPATSLLIWLRHMLDAERATRGMPRAFVHYEDLLRDWRKAAASIASRVGVAWPRWSPIIEADVDRFLASDLRHHEFSGQELSERSDVPDWVTQAYEVLTAFKKGEDNRSLAQLDDIRASFDQAATSFGLALADAERAPAANIDADRDAKTGATRQSPGAQQPEETAGSGPPQHAGIGTAGATAKGAGPLPQIDASRIAIIERDAEIERLTQAGETSRHLQETLEGKISALQLDLSKKASEVETSRNQIHLLREDVKAHVATIGRGGNELDLLKTELTRSRGHLREAQGELQGLLGEVEVTRAALAKVTEERDDQARHLMALQGVELELDATRTQLDEIAAERDGHARQVAALQGVELELSAARSKLGEMEAQRGEQARQLTALQGVERELAATRAQLSEAAAQRDDMQSRLEATLAERDGFAETFNEANEKLLETADLLRASRHDLVELETAYTIAKEEIAFSEQRNEKQQAENEHQQAENAELRGQAEAARAELRRLDERAGHLEITLGQANAALGHRNHDVAKLTGDLQQEQVHARALRETIARQSRALDDIASARRSRFGDLARAVRRRLLRSTSRDFGAKAWEGELVLRSRLFDAPWYLLRYPDVEAQGVDPLVHYVLSGAAENRSPNPLFDVDWYAAQCPDLPESRISPLAHYISIGFTQGRDPNPLFDTDWYLRQNPDVAAASTNPLFHYIAHGGAEGRDPHPLFDSSWYLQSNPDVAAASINPLRHYLEHGVNEGRDPHPLFDTDWYLAEYPEVAAKGLNPLAHYVSTGALEGYSPHPLFDGAWYLRRNPDVAAARNNPLEHFVIHGAREGRDPHPLFDTSWYVKQHPGVADENPLIHFLKHANLDAGLDPHPLFDSDFYLDANPDLATSGMNPLVHYLRHGLERLTSPHRFFDAQFYVHRNTEVAEEGDNPLLHYIETGASRGLDPHPLFNAAHYSRRNPDAAGPAGNPLVHFVLSGATSLAELEQSSTDAPADPAAAEPIPKNRFEITEALTQLLDMYHDRSGLDAITSCYRLLRRYGEREIGANDLIGLPELEALIATVIQLAAALPVRDVPDASIVIPVHNKFLYTLICVYSLLQLKTGLSFEILIADDHSSDATDAVFKATGGIVRHIRHNDNLGFNRNCNAAAKLARGRILILLNNDTLVLPGWLDALVGVLDDDPAVGLAGSKLVNDDGSLQEAGGILWNDASAWNFGRGDNACAYPYNYLKAADYISGASIALPRPVWDELGGFDDIFSPAYHEDTDLAFRVRRSGREVIYQPFSALIHHEGISHGRDPNAGIKLYQKRNAVLFFERWQDVLVREHYPDGVNVTQARDRSRSKPRILIVDHYVPQADRDAGSKSMWFYVEFFIEHGFHVTFWPHNLHFDPPYVIALERLGVEVVYGFHPTWPVFETWLKDNADILDYAFLSRPGVAADFIDQLRARSRAKILFYGHDLHHIRMKMEYGFKPSPELLAATMAAEQLERTIWSKSDVIYYPSTDEEQVVRELCPDRKVRTIPLYAYDGDEMDETKARIGREGVPHTRLVLFVGGFRHSPNVDAILWFVREIWPKVTAAVADCRLVVAGSSPPPEVVQLASDGVAVTGPISEEALGALYREAQVAIVPLRYGAGMKGKVLEALSLGVPLVSTAIGMQGLIEPAEFAEVYDDAEGFAQAVVGCLLRPENSVGKVFRGIEMLYQHFSRAAVLDVLGQDMPELWKKSQ